MPSLLLRKLTAQSPSSFAQNVTIHLLLLLLSFILAVVIFAEIDVVLVVVIGVVAIVVAGVVVTVPSDVNVFVLIGAALDLVS